ncbi:MAG: MFS transporter [Candidatus Korarchaeota archaeon]|nr:MFS transporter [Thermoproteota archaeon]MCR8463221.1 MFS transporter [Thermoproteota archaeon]MCR8471876.1 MFS transporter [Thermoproteota archaeon]MCR8488243.1 MFS transporter [Thermoproteota archaeon]
MDTDPQPKRVFPMLYCGTFIFRIACGMSALLAIMVLEALGFSMEALMLFAIAFSSVEGLIAGATGYATDIMDARLVLLSSTLTAAISVCIYMLAFPFTGLPWVFLLILMIGHAVHGIASSLNVTPSLAVISRFTRYENRARYMGVFDMSLMYGRLVGIALSGVVFSFFARLGGGKPEYGLFGFSILAVLFIIAGLAFYFGLPHMPPERKGKVEHIWRQLMKHIGAGARVMFSKLRRDMGITWFVLASLWGLAYNLGPYVMLRDFGIHQTETGFITAIIVLLVGGTAPFWGYVADRIGRKKTTVIGISGLLITAILGIVATSVFRVSYKDMQFYWIISPGIFCFASIAPTFLGRLGDTAIKGERGIVSSGFQFVTSMGEVSGTIIGGLGYIVCHRLLDGSALQPVAGIIGIGVPGIILFLLTLAFGYRLRPDEEILREVEKLSATGLSES